MYQKINGFSIIFTKIDKNLQLDAKFHSGLPAVLHNTISFTKKNMRNL